MGRRGGGARAWALGALGVLGLTFACASTEMESTWTDPAAKGSELSKVAVVCLTDNEGVRRMAEDEVAKQVKTAQVVPSYKALAGVDLKDKEAVKAKLRAEGYQGVLVMRVASVEEQPVYDYTTFDGYYDWAAGPGAPQYVGSQTTVRVVSNLYSLEQNRLLWSGTSKTFDPATAKQVVDDVSRAVVKSLAKDQLLI